MFWLRNKKINYLEAWYHLLSASECYTCIDVLEFWKTNNVNHLLVSLYKLLPQNEGSSAVGLNAFFKF